MRIELLVAVGFLVLFLLFQSNTFLCNAPTSSPPVDVKDEEVSITPCPKTSLRIEEQKEEQPPSTKLQVELEDPNEFSPLTNKVLSDNSLLDRSFKEYIRFHKKMIAKDSKLPSRFLLWRCGSGPLSAGCAGFGDRVKSILNAFALAIITKRAILLDSHLLFDFKEVYEIGDIDWRKETAMNNGRLTHSSSVRDNQCFMKDTGACLIDGALNSDDIELINHESNYDLAGEITHFPAFAKQFLSQGFLDGNWRGRTLSLLLIPNAEVKAAIKTMLKGDIYPDIAIHIRVGGHYTRDGTSHDNNLQPADRAQSVTSFEENADRYFNCMNSAIARNQLNPKEMRVFATSDVSDMIDEMEKKVKPHVADFLTGREVGALGHLSRDISGNYKASKVHIRVIAEFEIFRNARILLSGESGLSLMAYRGRARNDQLVYSGWGTCLWPWIAYYISEGD